MMCLQSLGSKLAQGGRPLLGGVRDVDRGCREFGRMPRETRCSPPRQRVCWMTVMTAPHMLYTPPHDTIPRCCRRMWKIGAGPRGQYFREGCLAGAEACGGPA